MQDEESFIRVSEIDETDEKKRAQTIETAVAKVFDSQRTSFLRFFIYSYRLTWYKLQYQSFTAIISVTEG